MRYDCLIIDDEKMLADNTRNILICSALRRRQSMEWRSAAVFCGKMKRSCSCWIST